ncbi:caspase family protein [Micromonospora vinacea]|uniref:caspase family protein n=1 Tax=Micromonospora vinacea TaxID=709878 RepID=UPI003D8CFD40
MASSRRWAVLIGVDQCGRDVQLPPLRYAESDAAALRDVLLDQDIGTFDDGAVQMFIGPDATWREIKLFLRDLALRSAPSDVLFVYFAGHTLVPQWSDQLDAYLVTADLDPGTLAREPDNGLRMSFLKRDIFDAFAGASFLVLDCCHAGVYADADRRNAKVLQSYAEAVDRPRHNALLACPSGSVTRESAEYGHGTLTHHVLRALRGGAGDEAGRVSFAQMATFVAEQGMDPPPVHTAHVYGATTVLTQPPMSRHDRQALNSPANPGISRPCSTRSRTRRARSGSCWTGCSVQTSVHRTSPSRTNATDVSNSSGRRSMRNRQQSSSSPAAASVWSTERHGSTRTACRQCWRPPPSTG